MINVYKNLMWFFRKEWKQYVLLAVMYIIISVLVLIPTRVIGEVIDLIETGELVLTDLFQYVFLLVIVAVVLYFLHYFYHYLLNREKKLLGYELRERYINKLFDLDHSIYDEFSKGELYSRVTEDLEAITVAATNLLESFFSSIALFIVTVLAMVFTIHLSLTIFSLAILPFAFILFFRAIVRMHREFRSLRERYATMANRMLETIEGVKVIRAYNGELKQIEALDEDIDVHETTWQKIVRFEVNFQSTFDFVYVICFLIAFIYGSYLVLNYSISVGKLVSFVIYLGTLRGPLLKFGPILSDGLNAIVSNERLEAILNKGSFLLEPGATCQLNTFESLTFDGVYFKYPFDKDYTLRNINLTIQKGETIGIVGPMGSGKSTLIRQVFRQFNLTDGTIYINGEPIENYPIEQIRYLIGYVPQAKYLFGTSFNESLLIDESEFNTEFDYQRLEQALTSAGLKHEYQRFRDGHSHRINELGSSLSGGEKQRLAIARALLRDPEILILDDSLGSLDVKAEKEVIENIRRERKNKTNIIVTKQLAAVKDAHKIIVLDEGEIVAMGTHDELMETNEWYRHQYELQTGVEE